MNILVGASERNGDLMFTILTTDSLRSRPAQVS